MPLSDEGASDLVRRIGRQVRYVATVRGWRSCAVELDSADGTVEVRWRRRDDDPDGEFWLTICYDDDFDGDRDHEGEPLPVDPALFRDHAPLPADQAPAREQPPVWQGLGDEVERWLSERESDDPRP